ncbi:MAG TPA: response regulator transcription factor, partial [Diaminobutyricibacter sp.]
MTHRIRVALVDDQALFRTGIRMLVSSQPDLEFVGEAANGVEGISVAETAEPDVILMDIRMPVMDGIQATEAILKAADERGDAPPRIIVLTTFDLDEAATRAIRGGASGFLLKDADPEFLLAAIRTVYAGT